MRRYLWLDAPQKNSKLLKVKVAFIPNLENFFLS